MAVMWAHMKKVDGAVAKAAAFILLNRIKKTDMLKDAYKDAVLAALILMIEKSGDEDKDMLSNI